MESTSNESSVMESLLKNTNIDWSDFLQTIWEKKCHRFERASESTTPWAVDGWETLTHMLDTTAPMCATNDNNIRDETVVAPPLLFRDLQPMDDPEEIQQLFGSSLYRAYLAGTSIVWNHADAVSPKVASLCRNLQQEFPHVYANAYLTPPNSQTVPAHADDRDVLVFQLVGRKEWKVYETIPIPHPYPHQQVGKGGIPVPEAVLQGPKAFQGSLLPGDVLYLPRGMVHEASTTAADQSSLSFHITVALATHDWTLGGNLGRMIQTKLSEIPTAVGIENNNLRRSLLPTGQTATSDSTSDGNKNGLISCGGSLVDSNALQKQLDHVFESLASQITAESILRDMNQRIQVHNERKSKQRQTMTQQPKLVFETELDRIVGPMAATTVTLQTTIRAATPQEKETVPKTQAGLTVRDGVGDEVAAVVGAIKSGSIAKVQDFCQLTQSSATSTFCDLTALSLAKRAVELGAFAIVLEQTKDKDSPSPKRQRIET